MPRLIIHGNDARAALARGVQKLAATIESTLGPMGMNAMIDRPIGTPLIRRDGVSIASERRAAPTRSSSAVTAMPG